LFLAKDFPCRRPHQLFSPYRLVSVRSPPLTWSWWPVREPFGIPQPTPTSIFFSPTLHSRWFEFHTAPIHPPRESFSKPLLREPYFFSTGFSYLVSSQVFSTFQRSSQSIPFGSRLIFIFSSLSMSSAFRFRGIPLDSFETLYPGPILFPGLI